MIMIFAQMNLNKSKKEISLREALTIFLLNRELYTKVCMLSYFVL